MDEVLASEPVLAHFQNVSTTWPFWPPAAPPHCAPVLLFNAFDDVWMLDGVRTPMVDYCGALGHISPTDLGIKAARAVLLRAGVPRPAGGLGHHRQHGAGRL
jgi:hypothetical protein